MRRDGTGRELNRGLAWGLAATVLLPVALAVVLGLGGLMAALGDDGGAVACQRLALVAGGLWIVSIVATTVLNAIAALERSGRRRRPRGRRRMPSAARPDVASHVVDELRDRPA